MFNEKAKWIGAKEHIWEVSKNSPSLRLRKEFVLDDFSNSKCLICGLGYFYLYANGQKVGDDVLSPAFTDLNKRINYLTYDLTKYLRKGKNVIAVEIGDGWANQTVPNGWNFHNAPWRTDKKLLFDLVVDGESVLYSDLSWKVSLKGATIHSAYRMGEYYDARLEDGWKDINYDDSNWNNAILLMPPGGILEEQVVPPIRECEVINAVSVTKGEKGWVFDFGKNISGYVSIKSSGVNGETAILKYSERFDGKNIDQVNIGRYTYTDNFSQDRYTFKGEGVEEWKPKFVYHGFQYVELSGISFEPTIDTLTAYFVHTDLVQKASFGCSEELLDWLYQKGIQSFLSNCHSIIQDCPHREKNGWTGDAAMSAQYAVWNFDCKDFFKKILKDICDTQKESGQLCAIAPTSGWGYHWGSGPAWDSAIFILPYALYLETGDVECIEYVYDYAKKYLSYAEYYDQDGLVKYGLWDWEAPKEIEIERPLDNKLSDSCYYYKMLKLMSEFAKIKGNNIDESKYLSKAERVRKAILDEYVHDDLVDNCGQGAYGFILYYGIVDRKTGIRIAKNLKKRVEDDQYKIKCGMMGLQAVLASLSDYGYVDTAYKMVVRYDYPSFGYWKINGATSMWENWEGKLSLNHHMYGDVLNWMCRHVTGVQNLGVAYDKLQIKPYFFAKNCSSFVQMNAAHGLLKVKWEKRENMVDIELVIPEECTAEVVLPNGNIIPGKTGKLTISLS